MALKERRIKRLKRRAARATKRGNIKRATRLSTKGKDIIKRKKRSDAEKEALRKKGVYVLGNW